MIDHAMYILLGLGISIDLNIAFPKFFPGLVVELNKTVPALQFGIYGQPLCFIQRVIVLSGCDGGSGD